MTVTDPLNLEIISVGLQPNDGQGDTVRNAFSKINSNSEILNANVRIRLNNVLTLYVSTANGSDTNNGLTLGSAYKTIARALVYVSALDIGETGQVVIQLDDGTYREKIKIEMARRAKIKIQGKTNRELVKWEFNYADEKALEIGSNIEFEIENITFIAVGQPELLDGETNCSFIEGRGCEEIRIKKCVFSELSREVVSAHIHALNGATIIIDNDYYITGGSKYHYLIEKNARLISEGTERKTIAVTNSNFEYLIGCETSSVVEIKTSCTYSGGLSGGLYKKDHTSTVKMRGVIPNGVSNKYIEPTELEVISGSKPAATENSNIVATTEWVNELLTSRLNDIIANITGVEQGIPYIPIGTILVYAGTTAPSGYLLCDGKAYSREEYNLLFSVIGLSFGIGDGVTTFNIPDLRGKYPRGLNTGVTRDAKYSQVTLAQLEGTDVIRITESNLPAHRHNVEVKGHTHLIKENSHVHDIEDKAHGHPLPNNYVNVSGNSGLGITTNGVLFDQAAETTESYTGITKTKPAFAGITLDVGYEDIIILPTGAGTPIKNIPPSLGLSYIIKW